ncbi:MAG: hypothetical protein Q8P52_03575 [bacterium]|nr:hypothetical protein [bacterium]
MKAIQDGISFFFIAIVFVLSAISIFGVWEIFDGDVIYKSFLTLGLLSVISIIIMIAGRFIDNKPADGLIVPAVVNPAFGSIRRIMLGALIVSAAVLALLGVSAIWEVMKGEVLWKAVGSIGIICFASFLVVMTCREREMTLSDDPHKKNVSLGTVIVLVIVGLWLLSMFSGF